MSLPHVYIHPINFRFILLCIPSLGLVLKDTGLEGLGLSFGEALEERMEAVGEGIMALDDRVERARASVETALKELVRYPYPLRRRCDKLRLHRHALIGKGYKKNRISKYISYPRAGKMYVAKKQF